MDALLEIIKPIAEACAPLRVKVTVKKIKDKYYVHFDGTETYATAEEWDRYWISFNHYVIHLLTTSKLNTSNIKNPKPSYAIAMIGTLFDFLAKDHTCQ